MWLLIAIVLTVTTGIGTSYIESQYGFWGALFILPISTVLAVRLEKTVINSIGHSTGNEGAMIEASVSVLIVFFGVAIVHLASFGIIAHRFSLAALLILLTTIILSTTKKTIRVMRWLG